MNQFLAALNAALIIAASLAAAAQTPPVASAKKRPAAKKAVRRAPPVSAAARAAARKEIDGRMAKVNRGIENPAALTGYFAALDHAATSGDPVHILQFGDSHTASDDWVNAMRTVAQARYGDGGPGFVQAGRPYRGYRRFDASGSSSAAWKTDGNLSHSLDDNQGLSHVSISTQTPGQTVRLTVNAESLGIFYLRQPGGGQFEISTDGERTEIVSTDSPETGPGEYFWAAAPGQHEIILRTMHFAPVRLFGWIADHPHGVTLETLGINGAHATVLLNANEGLWASEVARRSPALVILAYGTNEANSHNFDPDQYRADLTEVIARVRRAVPAASILLAGPPDCGRFKPLAHLDEVIEVQRNLAAESNVAFWDWRIHMGGPRIVTRWVTAGLSQADYIHLTGEGYRLIGNLLFDQIEKAHSPSQ